MIPGESLTQEERSALRSIVRNPLLIKAINRVLAEMPVTIAREDLEKPFNSEQALARYYFAAGQVDAFNALSRLAYSLSDTGRAAPRFKVPQFRPEKEL